jgi:hypothetical protein
MRSFDVAAVIVTRTAELTIACLRSLQEERQASKEITVRAVVVDNASGDAAVIRPALEAEGWQSSVTLIEAPVNGGFAYGNNLGVQHACAQKSSDYVYSVRDELAHIRFTEEFFASLALAITRRVHALRKPAHKVRVLDCDNTLWSGVVGEDGVDGICFPRAMLGLQRFAEICFNSI